MRFLTIINSFYPQLSKQEKKIADFIKEKKQEIAIMNIQEITKEISVSEATITRFSKKIGFKGFVDLKLEIARENLEYKENIKGDYIENISKNIFNTIEATKNLINKEDLEKAIELIENADNIYAFGIGASGMAALELKLRFMRYGKLIVFENINHFQIMYSSMVGKNDLIIAISLTGETQDLIYPLEIAKEKGLKIIAITNYILSKLSKMSDLTLLTAGRETPLDGGSLISKISQLYIIDLLATGYAVKNESLVSSYKDDIAVAIANKN